MRFVTLCIVALWLVVAACTIQVPSSSDRIIEFYNVPDLHQEWYRAYIFEATHLFGPLGQVPKIRIYGWDNSNCPPPYCTEDGFAALACTPNSNNCLERLARIFIDGAAPALPVVFKDALADIFSGGIGHDDHLDYPIARDFFDSAWFDDDVYKNARIAEPWTHEMRVMRPAADFAAYILQRDGLEQGMAWLKNPSEVASAIAAWKQTKTTVGRMYRRPLAECSDDVMLLEGSHTADVAIQNLMTTKFIDGTIGRTGLFAFDIDEAQAVRVTTMSTLGSPWLRIEACEGRNDPGAQVVTAFSPESYETAITFNAKPGRYFTMFGTRISTTIVPTDQIQIETR